MGESEDGAILFNHIVGDMKLMGPIWDDFLGKAVKFYASIRGASVHADSFLDSFQKLADATTNSKGATRDLGVSFTKITMRQRSVVTKLKTYVGIMLDEFINPLQEKTDEWKRWLAQLEKDHNKDFKKLKTELKRTSADAIKLKRKASKKSKSDAADQYKEAMRITNSLSKTLMEQEKLYLRRIMIEERTRASFLFQCYKPCIQQELTLISEIEQLQSILDETTEQCKCPHQLPAMSEDAIEAYKVPDSLTNGHKEASTTSTPPPSPPIIRDRSLSFSASSSKPPLMRSNTTPVPSMNGYGTLTRKKGIPDPVSVDIPKPIKSQHDESFHSTSSMSSSPSLDISLSMLSLEQANTSSPQQMNSAPTSPDHSFDYSSELNMNSNIQGYPPNNMVNPPNDRAYPRQAFKTSTSWSSTETSDSSGIGSNGSLSYPNKNRYSSTSAYSEGSGYQADFIEADHQSSFDVSNDIPPQYAPPQYPMYRQYNGHSNDPVAHAGYNKYATIDRSFLQRNRMQLADMRGSMTPGMPRHRSNSLGEEEDFPCFPDYKLNLPKSKMNTIARTNYIPAGARPVFQGNAPMTTPPTSPQRVNQYDLQQKSPNARPVESPNKTKPPIAPKKFSLGSQTQRLPSPSENNSNELFSKLQMRRDLSSASNLPAPPPELMSNDEEEELEPARPGSFLDALQQKRNTVMKKRSVSVDHTAMMEQTHHQRQQQHVGRKYSVI